MALQGHKCEVKSASTGVSMTDEATTAAGNLTYTITDTAKLIIDMNTTLVVKDGGTATTEAYKVNYLNGVITFATAVVRTITVTGAYLTPTTVATADSFTSDITVDMLENTKFLDEFKTYQAGLVSGTVNLGRFFVADDLFTDDILNGQYKIIYLYVDPTHIIKMFGLLNSDSSTGEVADLIKETMTYQVTNEIEV